MQPEMMDQPDLDVRRHIHALDALGRANAVSRTAAAIWPSIRAVSREIAEPPLRVLDIACGGGHVLLSLARRAVRERMDVEWVGWDTSPVAIEYARTLASRRGVEGVRFEVADAFREPIRTGIDAAVCTLFLHHLPDADAVALLGRLARAARHAVVVSDLRRTLLGTAFTWVGCRSLSRSEVFRVDGMRSVAAAFTTDEARDLAAAAGLTGAYVREIWPQRWLLTWGRVSRPGTSLVCGV